MDPVSIIGLVATVTNLVHVSRRVVEFIQSLKNSDKAMIHLSSELCMFAEALGGFERVLRSRATIHRISKPAIDTMLENSMQTVLDLETRVKEICSSNISAIRQARWMQHASKIDKLHKRLKEQNAMLQTFLSISHACVRCLKPPLNAY